MSGLQQRDCEREQEVAWDHQEQQDPEEEKNVLMVKIKIFSMNLAVVECWSLPQRVETGEGQQAA